MDQFIGENGKCDYNRLFYVSDWFSTLLQIADGKLRKEDIDKIVSSYNDTIAVDSIGLWPDILSQCGSADNPQDGRRKQTESRKQLISARVCGENDNPDDQFLYLAMYVALLVYRESFPFISLQLLHIPGYVQKNGN